jgi:Asp-tRNA(Asn)/Glu-tRNA(Gln) amidotransferase A subunit family amidase
MALKKTRKMDKELAEGKYRGIPYGGKELMAVKGYKITWGAEPYKDQEVDTTATVVERLQNAGLVPFALGTETFGSITSPSTKNGITGLRPTYGRVSRHGVMSLSWSMDKVRPMTRSAEDCAIVHSVITGKDPKDQTTTTYPDGFEPQKDISTLRIAYLKKDIEKDTTLSKHNSESAIKTFKKLGLTLNEVELPEDIPYKSFDIILRA